MVRALRWAPAALVIWLSLCAPTLAEDEIMPLSEVKAGMKGFGKTVYRGTKVETFPFVVVDVMRNWYPGQDIILIRCEGPMMDKAKIVEGMSGSPCYIEGKVIGALAYGWSYMKEALAGVTPIESMIKISKLPLEKSVKAPVRVVPGKAGGLTPIRTPLFVSARSKAGMAYLEKVLEPYGMVPMQAGGGGGAFSDLKVDLEPGAALAVVLMTGDIEMYATGTLTWKKGNKLLAFGHSFFGSGEHSLPVANAWTYTVVARGPTSFKLQAPGRLVGTMMQDRQPGVYALLGKKHRLVPFSVHVKNPATKASHTFKMHVADHKQFTGNMVTFALVDALSAAEPGPEEEAKEVEFAFKPVGHDEVRIRTFVAGRGGFFANYGLARPLNIFLQNPFKEVHVESIDVKVTIVHKEKRALIHGITLERDEYQPGETVRLSVELKRPKKDPYPVTLEVALPEDLEPGEHKIEVRAQDEIVPWNAKAVEDVETLLHNLRLLSLRRSDRIVAVMRSKDYRLQHEGKAMDNVPFSVLAQLLPTFKTGRFFMKTRLRESKPVETGLYITGGKVVRIVVKKKID